MFAPDYAKTPDGKENWVQPKKAAERTQFYEKLALKNKTQAEKARERLHLQTLNAINGKRMEIQSIRKNPEMTLGNYLSKEVFGGSKALMLQALSRLQQQGYQVDFFPEGYTVEVQQNHLSIYKETAEGKEYYRSPDTGAAVKELELLQFPGGEITRETPREAIAAEEAEVAEASEPAVVAIPAEPAVTEAPAPPKVVAEPVVEPAVRAEPLPEPPPPPPPPEPEPALPEEAVAQKAEWPARETERQEAERNLMSHEMRKDLALLIQTDEALEKQGQSIDATLDRIEDYLKKLKENHPHDPDIYTFEKAYADLRADFEKGRETELDESLLTLSREMDDIIADAGVQQLDLGALSTSASPRLSQAVHELRRLNIQPSYVVQSPNPQAKTVVLFMQTHAAPPLDPDEAADVIKLGPVPLEALIPNRPEQTFESSQHQIRTAITRGVRTGLIRTVYDEGIPEGQTAKEVFGSIPPGTNFDALVAKLEKHPELLRAMVRNFVKTNGHSDDPLINTEIRALQKHPELLLEHLKSAAILSYSELGDQVHIQGYDCDALKMAVLTGRQELFHRMSSHNAFAASGLADLAEASSENMVFATMGAAHEQYPNTNFTHPLPFSHALAYYGMNVVVVDASLRSTPSVI